MEKIIKKRNMKNKLLSILLLASLSLHAQTELLPSVAWRNVFAEILE
jgi:hypothetical protein